MPEPEPNFQSISQEELERLESHVRDSLARAGLSATAVNPYIVTYIAHFIYETRIAPVDSNMVLIHRTVAWCVKAMRG